MGDRDSQGSSAIALVPAQARPTWELLHTDNAEMLALGGDWIAQSGRVPEFPADGLGTSASGRKLAFDTSKLGRWDSCLIAFLWDAKRAAIAAGLSIDSGTLPDSARKLLGLLPDRGAKASPSSRRGVAPLHWLGARTVAVFHELGVLSEMLGAAAKGGLLALAARARIRAIDLLANIRDAGPSALVIVCIVNFLIGAILAFVGAVQLRKFAAEIFVADLVGLAVVREMACVMTGIVMAGRTGGAYAARIATMRGNEELDALGVVGIPVSDYIVLPSVLALTFTMPLLYLFGCAVGMLGGLIVAVAISNISVTSFLNQTLGAVALSDFAFGFCKTIAFAIMIGLTSCRIGLLAGRSAADVGVAATRAVVVGIVGVIAMDAVFAVVADTLGI